MFVKNNLWSKSLFKFPRGLVPGRHLTSCFEVLQLNFHLQIRFQGVKKKKKKLIKLNFLATRIEATIWINTTLLIKEMETVTSSILVHCQFWNCCWAAILTLYSKNKIIIWHPRFNSSIQFFFLFLKTFRFYFHFFFQKKRKISEKCLGQKVIGFEYNFQSIKLGRG